MMLKTPMTTRLEGNERRLTERSEDGMGGEREKQRMLSKAEDRWERRALKSSLVLG